MNCLYSSRARPRFRLVGKEWCKSISDVVDASWSPELVSFFAVMFEVPVGVDDDGIVHCYAIFGHCADLDSVCGFFVAVEHDLHAIEEKLTGFVFS